MRSTIFRLGRHAGIYGIGATMGLVSSIVMFMVYARMLVPEHFGILTTIRVIIALAIIPGRLGLQNGIFRFFTEEYADKNFREAQVVLWTGLIVCLGAALTVTAILFLGTPLVISRWLGPQWVRGYQMEVLTVTLLVFYDVALSVLRVVRGPLAYVGLTVFNMVSLLVLTVLLVVGWRADLYGIFWADLITALVLVPVSMGAIARYVGRPAFSFSQLKRMARYAFPQVPSQIGEWAVQYSDRFFMALLATMGQQGIYSLGYRLGLVEQQVVIGGLQLAWEPFVLQNMKSADATRLIGRAVTYSVLLGIVPALLLGVLAAPLMSVVHVQPGYLAGAPVVFIVALAQWFGFMRFLFMTPTFVKVRPEWAVVVLIGAGVSNVILNLWLIPRFGMMGAAWATLGSYIVGAVLALVLGLRLWKIEFEYRRLFSILIAGLLTYWLVNMLEMQSAWLNLFLKFLATPTLFLLVLTLMWFWGAHEISLVRRRIAGFLVSENS